MAYHKFSINEIYSSADGTIQYIELVGDADGQPYLEGHTITVTDGVTTHTLVLDHDLASILTSGKSVLIATQGYADLGLVEPDFIMDDGFLFLGGGTIEFPGDTTAWDTLTYGLLPTDGDIALNGSLEEVTNSPSNFAGDTGSINLIQGTPDHDFLFSLAGVDYMDGLNSTDTAVYDYATSSVVVNLTTGRASGGCGNDILVSFVNVRGGDFNDQIYGDAQNNVLNGDLGADALYGLDGLDELYGDAGNDTLYGGNGGDSMYGGADIDTASYASGAVSGVVVNLVAGTVSGGAGSDWLYTIENITGSAFADEISGDNNANSLAGGEGADSLTGAGAPDTLNGGTGADAMTGGLGNDRYYVDNALDSIVESSDSVSGGVDIIYSSVTRTMGLYLEKLILTGSTAVNGTGNTLANTMTGNTGANSLGGSGGNDTLIGNAGNDTLNGGTGTDSMSGGLGNDVYYVDNAVDIVTESSVAGTGGIDTINSSVTRTLGGYQEKLILTGSTAINGTGNTLANTITGNTGANSLIGGSGNDTLGGGGGNDTLNGGAGNDRLTGGTGLDKFTFNTALSANIDTIIDFSLLDDTIQLDNAIFTVLTVAGPLAAANFRSNATGAAVDSNDYMLYETDTGMLFYDADGSGAGAKVQIATLVGLPALTSADFLVT